MKELIKLILIKRRERRYHMLNWLSQNQLIDVEYKKIIKVKLEELCTKI